MKKIKICGLTTETSAMKYFFLVQMEHLLKNGYDVDLVCDMDNEFYKKNSQLFGCIDIKMARGVDPIGMVKGIYKLYKEFKKNKYDLIQYTTPNASFYASIAGFLANVPVRYYCQWGIRYQGFNGFARSIFKFIEKITCYFSTHITLDSPGNLETNVIEKNFKREKAKVIHNGSVNGIDLDIFEIANKDQWNDEVREKYGINSGDFIIGYIGRLMKDKGTNELLYVAKKILSKYSNVKFILVGSIDKYKGLDTEIIKWAENEEKIIFVGTRNDIHKYISAFDLFVFPSYREGYGGNVIQAGALEVPAVVSNIPPLLDSIDYDKYGISTKLKDIDSLFLGIEKMYLDEPLRLKMGEEFREWVRKSFDRKTWLKEYLQYVNSIVNKGK